WPAPPLRRPFFGASGGSAQQAHQRRARIARRRQRIVQQTVHTPRGRAAGRRQRNEPRSRPPPERTVRYQREPPLVPEPRNGPRARPLRLERRLLRQRPRAARALRHQTEWPGSLNALPVEVIFLLV